jgi:hypothetical protein
MNNGTVSIVYDGFGNRVAETAGGVTKKYLVEAAVNPTGLPQVFDELTGSVVTRTYTYGLQRIDEDLCLAKITSGRKTELMHEFSVRICVDFRLERA